jgi:hypothetical protein
MWRGVVWQVFTDVSEEYTLFMETVRPEETSVNIYLHGVTSEDSNLHSHRSVNQISRLQTLLLLLLCSLWNDSSKTEAV